MNSFHGCLLSGSNANGVFEGSEAIRVSDVLAALLSRPFVAVSCLKATDPPGTVNLETDRGPNQCTTATPVFCKNKANSSPRETH